ncbi:MAG TPA: hypothetical protein VIV06_09580 [Candidatus Limnocylindrales bacterium]
MSSEVGSMADANPFGRPVHLALDPGFRPAALEHRAFAAAASSDVVDVWLAVEQPGGSVAHQRTTVHPEGHRDAAPSYRLCERLLKFLLWSRGGSRIYVDGPAALVDWLRRYYAEDPRGRFDAATMGPTVYGRPFELVAVPHGEFPAERESMSRLGRHLDGCRIGFDLGASDRKVAAVMDGEVRFSDEVRWDPVGQDDPQWHFDQIMDSLRRAAAHLPRVDAIGGSAAGVYVDNEVRIASLFRSVPRELFETRVRSLFRDLRRAWGDVPFVVVNDGDVTALAGAMMAGVGSMLGIAMGSSEAVGYVTPDGMLTSWLNELAFAPVDYAPDAPVDEWSGDRGVGALYFSQQALQRLLPRAGIEVEPSVPLPDRLVMLQQLMAEEDPRACRIYDAIGQHLGYALLHYATFYVVDNVLLLGRVMSGPGGDRIVDGARQVLRLEDPSLAERVAIRVPSERDKRHGQAVAAASLPAIE